MAVGLQALLADGSGRPHRIDLDALIDMALAAVAAVLVLWETALRSLMSDTTVSFGPHGSGLTHTVLHDVEGPVGTSTQTLALRPHATR